MAGPAELKSDPDWLFDLKLIHNPVTLRALDIDRIVVFSANFCIAGIKFCIVLNQRKIGFG